jgi:hypothetical protein
LQAHDDYVINRSARREGPLPKVQTGMQSLHPAGPEGGSTRKFPKETIMSVRKSMIIFALVAAGLPVANAQSAMTWVGGEVGFVDGPTQSTLTREQVRQEMLAFRANPIAADGARYVGGEAGYVPEQHAYARVDGQWVCIDNIGHDARPESFPSRADRLQFLNLYPA